MNYIYYIGARHAPKNPAEWVSKTWNNTINLQRERVQTLEVVARMVKTNPYDMRVALADARYAQISLTKEFQQLELLSKDVAAKQQVAQSLSEDLERKWTTGMNATLRGEIQALRKSADAASKKMKTLIEDRKSVV